MAGTPPRQAVGHFGGNNEVEKLAHLLHKQLKVSKDFTFGLADSNQDKVPVFPSSPAESWFSPFPGTMLLQYSSS